jgi:hypothetical protein
MSFSRVIRFSPFFLTSSPSSPAFVSFASRALALFTGLDSCALIPRLGSIKMLLKGGFGNEGAKSGLSRLSPIIPTDFFFAPRQSSRSFSDADLAADYPLSSFSGIASMIIDIISFLARLTAFAGNDVGLSFRFLFPPPCGPSWEKLHAAAYLQ